MKLDVPRFDGIDSMSCIFNISQFFYYHATIEEERLQVALFYLDDLILRWYQWTTTRCSLGSHSSKHLTCVLLPLSCDDPKGTLLSSHNVALSTITLLILRAWPIALWVSPLLFVELFHFWLVPRHPP